MASVIVLLNVVFEGISSPKQQHWLCGLLSGTIWVRYKIILDFDETRWWGGVASAGPYANHLHFAADYAIVWSLSSPKISWKPFTRFWQIPTCCVTAWYVRKRQAFYSLLQSFFMEVGQYVGNGSTYCRSNRMLCDVLQEGEIWAAAEIKPLNWSQKNMAHLITSRDKPPHVGPGYPLSAFAPPLSIYLLIFRSLLPFPFFLFSSTLLKGGQGW